MGWYQRRVHGDTCPLVRYSSTAEMEQILVVVLGVIAAISAAPVAHHDGVAFHHVAVAPVFYTLPRITYDINTVPQVIAPPRVHLPVAVEAHVEDVPAVEDVAAVEEASPVEAAPEAVAEVVEVVEDAAVMEAVTEAPVEEVAAVEETVEEEAAVEATVEDAPAEEAVAEEEVAPLVPVLPHITYDLNTVPQVVAPPRDPLVFRALFSPLAVPTVIRHVLPHYPVLPSAHLVLAPSA